MREDRQDRFVEMTEAPIAPLIIRLAIPCIISMLVSSFYNMADTFFVGMLDNNSATGAVGVVFSVMALIQAVGFFFGQGSGTFISRSLGQQDQDSASKMVATGFTFSLLFGAALCCLGLLFLDPLTRILGSTETIFPYAREYLKIILLGAPWMSASLVLNNQLRYQGNATYAMFGITFGSVLNIVLDPILIFTFDMGVSGAAAATVISQFVSFCLLLIGSSQKGNLPVQLRLTQFSAAYLKNVFVGGFPAFAKQSLASLATILLNSAAREYGDVAIAAMSVTQRIMMFGASAMLGFGQGFQPFCGFNFGAKKYRRVIEGFLFSVKTSACFLTVVGIVGIIFAPQLISLFRDDPAVIACGALALRLQCATLFTHSSIVLNNMLHQAIGDTLPATFLSISRQGLFLGIMLLMLPPVMGLLGIQSAQSLADLCSFICALLVQRHTLKRLRTLSS